MSSEDRLESEVGVNNLFHTVSSTSNLFMELLRFQDVLRGLRRRTVGHSAPQTPGYLQAGSMSEARMTVASTQRKFG